MMKYLFGALALCLLAAGQTASAQMGMMWNYGYVQESDSAGPMVVGSQELADQLSAIYTSQGVSEREELDCSAIPDEQFEALGDAYMGVMHPNEQQHELMDQMMGGENSQTLSAAHINMGRAYLGCWSDYSAAPVVMPMMGGFGMMNSFGPYRYNVWGDNVQTARNYHDDGWMPMNRAWHGGYGFSGLFTTILIWSFLILGIIVFVRWLKLHK